jgi:hypothetical protein
MIKKLKRQICHLMKCDCIDLIELLETKNKELEKDIIVLRKSSDSGQKMAQDVTRVKAKLKYLELENIKFKKLKKSNSKLKIKLTNQLKKKRDPNICTSLYDPSCDCIDCDQYYPQSNPDAALGDE